jgi:lipid II isoglutaminyl synthase (glutamine-hydrolysing)
MTSVTIATLFPRTTVAAGDEANAAALARRAAARGIQVRTATVNRPESMLDADLYLIGGTGRTGTADLVDRLREVELRERAAGGAVVFAVDAGMDALSRSWVDAGGTPQPGLGLLPLAITAGPTITDTIVANAVPALGLPSMLGWVSYDTHTSRPPGVPPLCSIERGAARAALEPDGAVAHRIIATRLHGPALALNPELADLVLSRYLGALAGAPVPPAAARARSARIAEIRATSVPRHRRWRR